MRIPIKVTDDLQRHLGCDGITLESVFIEQKPSLTTILVYYVDLAQNLINASSPVVKFSKSEFAIPRAEFLKLATPDHYRTYEGCGSGIPDEMEAKYPEGIRSFFTRYGTLDADSVASVSGNVTYVVPDFWMFCTSMEPTSTRERESLCRGLKPAA